MQSPSTATPFDEAFCADPHATHARLREEGAVHKVTTPDGAPVWLVTRYEDVRSALADPRLSLNKLHSTGGYRGFALPPALDANLLNLDPPAHTRLRRLVTGAFTARRIDALRPAVQHEVDRLLKPIAARGHADIIAEFAVPLALTVIGDLLGVPADGRDQFRDWTNTLLAPDNPDQARQAVHRMHQFLVDLVTRTRHAPSDDLLSALIDVRDHGDRLTEDELVSLAFLLFWAGYENTVDLIGNGVLALLADPTQLAGLRADPNLMASAIDELLRYANPNQFAIRRFAVEDVDIAGTRIAAGETVLLDLASANRDPQRFAHPDTLDLRRGDNPHLAFGHGGHYCLGAPLARLEAHIALHTLLHRFNPIALAAPIETVRWRGSFRQHGLRALPLHLVPHQRS